MPRIVWKLVATLLLSVVGLGMVGSALVGAQSPVIYNSGLQIQNPGTAPATVQLQFYDQNGPVGNPVTYTIDPQSSRTFFPIQDVPSGFVGSLVISSDQDVRAVTNILGYLGSLRPGPGDYFTALNAFSSGATSLNLPLIMCNNSGFNTWFAVQNVGTADATITIHYIPGSNGTPQTETATIKPNTAKIFDQTAGSPTVNCSRLADASGRFIGSATITSTNNQPLTAVVLQINTNAYGDAYAGFDPAAATNQISVPLVMANNAGYFTGIQVQNVGSSPARVTIAYGRNTVGSFQPQNEVFDLAPGASKTIIQNGAPPANGSAVNNWGTNRYVGSATISAPSGARIVAIVNQLNLSQPGDQFASTTGFNY